MSTFPTGSDPFAHSGSYAIPSMTDRVATYIDGESHYERLLSAWQKLHGKTFTLDQLRFRDEADGRLILHVPDAKVFWTQRWSPGQRITYFTACSGAEGTVHDVRVKIRAFGLDHHVIHEKKQLAQKRRDRLEQGALIEKPKGVDCAIFVQMLEDAQLDLYQLCNLYTSDADYVPVIKAVQRRGKHVVVHGFKDALGDYSELEHVAAFVDLGEMLTSECECVTEKSATPDEGYA